MADPTTYPVGTISKLLKMTDRRVQQLAKEGVIPKSENGRYPLIGAVQGYITYLQARALGGDAAPSDVYAERGRLTRANADLAEFQVQELRGSLIRSRAVAEHWTGMVASMRAKLLALPSKLAGAIAPPDKMQAAQESAQALVYEALNEIAGDGLPQEREAGAAGNRVVGEEYRAASAEPVDQPVGGGKPNSQR